MCLGARRIDTEVTGFDPQVVTSLSRVEPVLMVGLFRDDPNAVSVRDEQLEAHLAYLDEHADRIIAAGALRLP